MLKKILFGFAAMLSLAACTGDYTDWAEPQHNDQPQIVKFGDGSVASVDLIDFSALPEDVEGVQVCKIVPPSCDNDGYMAAYEINFGDESFLIDGGGTMTASDLKAYVEKVYGKAPTIRELTATVSMVLLSSTSSVRMATSEPFTVRVKLNPPHIAENFYIIGQPQGWSNSKDGAVALPFTHSAQSVYDDPTFTVTFPAGDGDCWFAILSGDDVDAFVGGDWNVLIGNKVGNGCTDFSGELTSRSAFGGENNFMMSAGTGAYYQMTINMMDYTYTIKPVAAYETWYLVGSDIADGKWNNSPEGIGLSIIPMGVKSVEESNILTWTGYLAGNGFKLIKTPGNWDDQWGQGASFGEFLKNNGGSGNINVPSAGYYTVTLNIASDELSIEPYTGATTDYAVGIAGSINGWSFAAMNASAESNNHDWYCNVESAAGDEVKFLIDGWSVNWGAEGFPYGVGVNNGPNIPVKAGNWIACFNDITGAYTFIAK